MSNAQVTLPADVPAPTIALTPDRPAGYHGPHRDYVFTWVLGEVRGAFDVDSTPNAVRLTIGHNKMFKRYEAEVKVVAQHGAGHTETLMGFLEPGELPDGQTLATAPAARYSRKALDTFAAGFLADFPHNIGTNSKAPALWAQIVAAANGAAAGAAAATLTEV